MVIGYLTYSPLFALMALMIIMTALNMGMAMSMRIPTPQNTSTTDAMTHSHIESWKLTASLP